MRGRRLRGREDLHDETQIELRQNGARRGFRFKMYPKRRNHRVEAAKTQLLRSAQGSQSAGVLVAEKQAAAILLSQGIRDEAGPNAGINASGILPCDAA